MAKLPGRLSSVAVSGVGLGVYTEIGCVRDATFNGEKAEIGSTCRDDGDFEAFLQGRKSGSIDVSAAWDEADAQLMQVVDAYYANTLLDYRWRFQNNAGDREYEATGLVTGLVSNGPNDDLATVDITIRLTGTITQGTQ